LLSALALNSAFYRVVYFHFNSPCQPTFKPSSLYPVYSPTKFGIHSFAVSLRAQLNETSVNVIEIAPPYVDTDLNKEHRANVAHLTPMPVDEYMAVTMAQLKHGDGLKEVATGFSAWGADAWRGAFNPILEQMSISA
jgi:uncharacterized oxidoreductase